MWERKEKFELPSKGVVWSPLLGCLHLPLLPLCRFGIKLGAVCEDKIMGTSPSSRTLFRLIEGTVPDLSSFSFSLGNLNLLTAKVRDRSSFNVMKELTVIFFFFKALISVGAASSWLCCKILGLQEVSPIDETMKTAATQNSLGKVIGCSINSN